MWATYWSYRYDIIYDTEFWCQECVDLGAGMGFNIGKDYSLDIEPRTA